MDLGIAGLTAIVCASSRGLGKACATALAREGVRVVINGRDPTHLGAAEAEIRRLAAGEVVAVDADVTTPAGRSALLAAAGRTDILVNNAGGPPAGDFRDFSRDVLQGSEDSLRLQPVPPCGWTDLGTPARVAACLALLQRTREPEALVPSDRERAPFDLSCALEKLRSLGEVPTVLTV